ncbi:hypothetical protein DCAR_0313051 [Daucus carota subsp. sativus]|uniref:Endonuclease/exonuclease/phosphatase domain-containing protein n=1 Tax=Daucus carota subsp. sativus TaxID=79200 RepID=A0AAF1ASH5_DAUCS|nr:hypothetical protein DCAR_0313051 [Daucus carota subsp. sativus]
MACSTNSASWLSHGFLISTSNKSLSRLFKPTTTTFCCFNNSTPSSSLSKKAVSSEPEICRSWVEADDAHLVLPLLSQARFKVVSYNILGDKNASKHKDLYLNVPSSYMNWGRRNKLIQDELTGWDPDIICLQEVDKYYDLSFSLEKAGYLGSYKRRTGDMVDGCAMFWKSDKFRLIDKENIEFKQFGLRDNVAQLSVFEMCRDESLRIVVGNIHVLFRPSRGEIKIGQIRLLSSKAHDLSKKWGNIPVVLAGDYNSTPQSEIYEFISSSELNVMLHDRRDLSGQKRCHPNDLLSAKREKSYQINLIDRSSKACWTNEELKVATGTTDTHVAVHPLKLSSSYSTVQGSMATRDSIGEPLATSYHSKFLGTVDYLWHTSDLKPTRVMDTVPIDILQKTRGLPSKNLGSDHLALISEFAFLRTPESISRNLSLEK